MLFLIVLEFFLYHQVIYADFFFLKKAKFIQEAQFLDLRFLYSCIIDLHSFSPTRNFLVPGKLSLPSCAIISILFSKSKNWQLINANGDKKSDI